MDNTKQQHAGNVAILNSDALLPPARPVPVRGAEDSSQMSASQSSSGKVKSKEYIPKKGSANYAFLICMYKGHKMGKPHYLKDELMNLSETSGLADRPIFGSNAPAAREFNAQHAYNGWSCIKVCVCAMTFFHFRITKHGVQLILKHSC